jgi:hypothetical protein
VHAFFIARGMQPVHVVLAGLLRSCILTLASARDCGSGPNFVANEAVNHAAHGA